jgi:DNA-binding PadR family transcriptional regulator
MSPRQHTPLSLEYILLGYLNQKPIHGYDLYKQIQHPAGIGLVWHIKQSQLYALLDRLEMDGLLTSALVPGEAHPLRKEYNISSLGRQTFIAWMRSPVLHERDMRQEFLARLFFAQNAGTEIAIELITEQHQVCLEWLESKQLRLAGLYAEQRYERMVYQFRIAQTETTLAWLDLCRKELNQ